MNRKSNINRDNEIRELAYRFWQDEGCPEGREVEHWLRAEAALANGQPKERKAQSPKLRQPTVARTSKSRQTKRSATVANN